VFAKIAGPVTFAERFIASEFVVRFLSKPCKAHHHHLVHVHPGQEDNDFYCFCTHFLVGFFVVIIFFFFMWFEIFGMTLRIHTPPTMAIYYQTWN
jgi:hypothetical protein